MAGSESDMDITENEGLGENRPPDGGAASEATDPVDDVGEDDDMVADSSDEDTMCPDFDGAAYDSDYYDDVDKVLDLKDDSIDAQRIQLKKVETFLSQNDNSVPSVPSLMDLIPVYDLLNKKTAKSLTQLIFRISDNGLINSPGEEGSTMLLSWVKLFVLEKDSATALNQKREDTREAQKRKDLQLEVLKTLLHINSDQSSCDKAGNNVISYIHRTECFPGTDFFTFPLIVAGLRSCTPTGPLKRYLRLICYRNEDALHLLKIVINNGQCDLHRLSYDGVSSSEAISKLTSSRIGSDFTPGHPRITASEVASVCMNLYRAGCALPDKLWLHNPQPSGSEYQMETARLLSPLTDKPRTLLNCCEVIIFKALQYYTNDLAKSVRRLPLPKLMAEQLIADFTFKYKVILYRRFLYTFKLRKPPYTCTRYPVLINEDLDSMPSEKDAPDDICPSVTSIR